MATAAELLADVVEIDRTLVIDNSFRTIKIPSTVPNLGVEYDDEVLRLNFKMPRFVSDTDLSDFPIRINYINAKGESDAYTVREPIVGDQDITFSWLVGPTATRYKGNTKFNVCLKQIDSEGYVLREFNTTIATLPVLEGLEVDESIVTNYSDIIEQWRQELFNGNIGPSGGVGKETEAGGEIFNDYENNIAGGKAFSIISAYSVYTEGNYKMLPLKIKSAAGLSNGDYLGGKVVVSYGGGKSGQDFTVMAVNGKTINLMPNAGIIALLSDPTKMQLLASFTDCDLVSPNGDITKIKSLDISNVQVQGIVITVDSSKGFTAGQSVSIDINNCLDTIGMIAELHFAEATMDTEDIVVLATSAYAPIDFDNINYQKSYLTSVKDPTLGDIDIGKYSSASGTHTKASGIGAHAEGQSTIASEYAHAEGYMTEAKGMSSHAEGNRTKATGYFSHAEGYKNESSGTGAHSEGLDNKASGGYSHAEGVNNKASGEASHAEGSNTQSLGNASHAEGHATQALGHNAHAEGNNSVAFGGSSHVEGLDTKTLGVMSHAEGNKTVTGALCDMVAFVETQSDWNWNNCQITKQDSGTWTTVKKLYLQPDTSYTVVSLNSVNGYVVGDKVKIRFNGFLADFEETIELIDYEGNDLYITSYSADSAHAEGLRTWAKARYSRVSGINTIATAEAQTVEGTYNAVNDDAVHIVGNGTSASNRKNAFEVYKDGHAEVQTMGTTNKSVATREYVNNVVSDIESALDEIIAIQESLLGGAN